MVDIATGWRGRVELRWETADQSKNENFSQMKAEILMNIPSALLNRLRANEVDYEILPHAEAFTGRMAAAAEDIAPPSSGRGRHGKVPKRPIMTVLPADRQLDSRKLESITQGRTALQSEGELASLFPDCAVGAMPPFGNLYGLPTYIGQHFAKEDYIVFQVGSYTELSNSAIVTMSGWSNLKSQTWQSADLKTE